MPFPLCEDCGENIATVSITQVINQTSKSHEYCETCARKRLGDGWLAHLTGQIVSDNPDLEEHLKEAFAEIPMEEIMSSLFEGVDFEANADAGFLTDDDLDANGDEAEDDDFAPQDTARDVSARCPTCGTTWDRLKTDGRAGCSGCYAAFRSELNEVMTRLQRGGQHLGKTPKAAGKRRRRLDHLRQRRDHQLQLLQNRLKEAVASEQYEEAATLRDKIKIVSSTIVSS